MEYRQIEEYSKNLESNIFTVMEYSKQDYIPIMMMPIQRFYNYIDWKSKLEDEKQKMLDEESNRK